MGDSGLINGYRPKKNFGTVFAKEGVNASQYTACTCSSIHA